MTPSRPAAKGTEAGLPAEDAIELADLLRFLGEWLAADREQLEDSLARFVGSTPYCIDMLRHDLSRFRFLLGGSSDEDEDVF
jgi:hypothetical protein